MQTNLFQHDEDLTSTKDWSVSSDPASTKELWVKILHLAAEGHHAGKIIHLLNIKSDIVYYWFKRFEVLGVLRLEGKYPKTPVLLVSEQQALDFLKTKIKLSNIPKSLVKIQHLPNFGGSKNQLPLKTGSFTLAEPSLDAAGGLRQEADTLSHQPASSKLSVWSVHKFQVRFLLKGRIPAQCDRVGKNGKKYWYLRELGLDQAGGVDITGSKKSVIVTVYGVPRQSSVESTSKMGSELAGKAAMAWAQRYGARLQAQGQLVGRRDWVLEVERLCPTVISMLNLDKQPFVVQSETGLAKWITDASHPGKVEVTGAGSDEQVKNFEWLVNGNLRVEVSAIRGELSETRGALVKLGSETAELARLVRESLKPPEAVLPTLPRNWKDMV